MKKKRAAEKRHVQNTHKPSQLNWIKIDNAGNIYPASKRWDWTALFRVSATLSEPIDKDVLTKAQESTLSRFPTFSMRLRSGLFWYYLDRQQGAPEIQNDVNNPCVRMNLKENNGFMLRVRYYDRTIALEVFHVLSDGTGGMSFLLTLVAEYLRIKYGASIPRNAVILDCSESPHANEIEDAYARFARHQTLSRKETNAYYISGTKEPMDNIHVISGEMSAKNVLEHSRALGVSLTEYLAAVLVLSVSRHQDARVADAKRKKPVKVGVPVNLRRFYDTNTKRNFASYINVGIEPRLGDYTLAEIAKAIHHQMGIEYNEKMLNAKFSTNVIAERNKVLCAAPLFLKNIALKATFNAVGDKRTSTTLSNLGQVVLPQTMEKYVERIDFLVGPLSRNRIVAGIATYQDLMTVNFIRTIKESEIEREFFRILVREGIHVRIASNSDGEMPEL